MYKFLKLIFNLFIKLKNWITFYFRQFFYFIYPNMINLVRKRIIFQTFPNINQFTLGEGSGIVEIGKDCSFGYKMGGFHRRGSIEIQAHIKMQ